MPYGKDWDHAKSGDVFWGNDPKVPAYKQFDSTNEGYDKWPCTWEDDCKNKAVGYIFDSDIGWNLACYEHVRSFMGDDTEHPFKPGPVQNVPLDHMAPGESSPVVAAAKARAAARPTVPKDPALCDNPHEGESDAPTATVIASHEGKTHFFCTTCALMFINDKVVVTRGDFSPVDLLSIVKRDRT